MHARRSLPISRRRLLQAGSLALGGLSLSDVLAAQHASGVANSDRAVILVWLYGGPTQLETYDLKPLAPTEYRSLFSPIATNVPGIDICELLPLQAKLADKFALVRSLHHKMSSHSDGHIEVLTGKTPTRPDPSSTSVSEHPDFGMVASKLLGAERRGMPPYVALPHPVLYTRPAYLGVEHKPFVGGADAFQRSGGLSDERLADRRKLTRQFDRFQAGLDLGGSMGASETFREMAFDMLVNPRIAEAFDFEREDPAVAERYGRHRWGRSCLQARRLAEAGAAVTTVVFNTPDDGEQFTNWDDHGANAGRPGHFANYVRVRLPYMDQALSALIEDIYARGLDRRVMVIAMGEFGRTPRISYYAPKDAHGRDHWPDAYTALVSGGGLRMGQAVGATNAKAEYPTERPYTPQDMLATIYRHLGIDYTRAFEDYFGRPVHILSDAQPIAELI